MRFGFIKAVLLISSVLFIGCETSDQDDNEIYPTSNTRFGNNRPTVDSQTITIAEDENVSIVVKAEDLDHDRLTYIMTSPPLHGILSGKFPDVTYLPYHNYNGEDSFTVKVSDGQIDSVPATITLKITPVNDPPVASDDIAQTNEDSKVLIDVLSNDQEIDAGDSLHIKSVTKAGHGEVDILGDQIVYIPARDYNGQDGFCYILSDKAGAEDKGCVRITVTPVNDAPVADAGEDATIYLGQHILISGSRSYDVDMDTLAYSWTLNGQEISTEKFFDYEANATGKFVFRLTVTDSYGAAASDSVEINVLTPNNSIPRDYNTTFVSQPPIISVSAEHAIGQEMENIDNKTRQLVEEAEEIRDENHFEIDNMPISNQQSDSITKRKEKILEELNRYEN